MTLRQNPWLRPVTLAAFLALGACSQTAPAPAPMPVAANPPPVAPGPNATWYHVPFATGKYTVDANGQKVVADVVAYLRQNPNSVATIIGRTDTVGSRDYNMHLSHQRADAVRDALVYGGKVTAERVETRWTGERRQTVATANDTATAENRVVDIAIH